MIDAQNISAGSSALQKWIREAFGAESQELGVTVNDDTVRGLPAAWYSLNKICGHIGSLPLNLYYRPDDEDAEIARLHPAYWLVRRRPNALMTASAWRETMQHHALLHGDGRSAIVRNGRGEPSELILMRPDAWAIVVEPGRTIAGQNVPARKWHVRIDDPESRIADADCLHIMGLSDDGFAGLGVIEAAKQALGLAIAQQTRAVMSEKNGARLKFLLKAPPGAFRNEADAKAFIDRFNEFHSGSENADKVGLIREGLAVEQISQTNSEAQAIESRKFSRQDIGLLFCVEQMLGDDSSVSYNSLEMKNQAYINNCLQRWMVRWEEECAAKLLTSTQYDSDNYYFKFVTAALLKGTTGERFKVYQIARQIGVLSANEVRELEDMNERDDDGGDSYDNPAITTPQAAPTQPSPQRDDNSDDGEMDTDEPALAARLRKVVAARMAAMVKVEVSRVEQAAATQANFVGWLDDFYATWGERMATAVSECDGPPAMASQWVADSQQRLLNVAGRVSSGLSEAVRAECASWTERANQLATAIVAGSV
jgi:HK97 family phage portal protein